MFASKIFSTTLSFWWRILEGLRINRHVAQLLISLRVLYHGLCAKLLLTRWNHARQ
jgi:hypothetical protein